ncbi:hypothetical protein B296_00037507 [Ensete ventricosum]|uniref:RING-type E3 ubiquitin transferase n=1 Tax=Ensete ventricosum TaxID=4639 RepID=A0A426XFN5_ENSVE|nr:hypothetical protein B296_00037507 [Ensete ventricosum]
MCRGLYRLRSRELCYWSQRRFVSSPGKTMSSAGNVSLCCQCGCIFTLNLANAGDGGGIIFCFHCSRSVALADPNPGVVIIDDQQPSSGDDVDPDPAPFDDVDMFPSSSIGLSPEGFLYAGALFLADLEQEFEHWYEEPIDLSASSFGTQSASRAAVEVLPDVEISVEAPGDDPIDCSICMESFDAGGVVKQMPCKHMFHDRCILPWLDRRNSCPLCRYEMPRRL